MTQMANGMMNPSKLFKCLADETRLKSLVLISSSGELCVCDLMQVLEMDQPKISRHLAELRKHGIVTDERRGKWVYYRLHPELPSWVKEIIKHSAIHCPEYYAQALSRLESSLSEKTTC